MDDSGGFKKKRQNVIGISLLILLLDFLNVQTPKELNIFNIKIPIENPIYFDWAIWLLFFYLTYRMYVEWVDSERKTYKSYMSNQVWIPLRTKMLQKISDDTELKDYSGRLSPAIIDQYLRRPWFYFAPLKVKVNGQEKIITRGIFNKYIWKDYFNLKVRGQFSRKYSSELYLPILLVLLVLFLVLIPIIFNYIINILYC